MHEPIQINNKYFFTEQIEIQESVIFFSIYSV